MLFLHVGQFFYFNSVHYVDQMTDEKSGGWPNTKWKNSGGGIMREVKPQTHRGEQMGGGT